MSAAEHRVSLPGVGGWSVWRWFVLRGAGFEAARVLRLAVPDLERRLRMLETWEERQARARAKAMEAVTRRITSADEPTRPLLLRIRRKIAAGEATPQVSSGEPAVDEALEELRRTSQGFDAEERELHAYVEQQIPKVAVALREQAGVRP